MNKPAATKTLDALNDEPCFRQGCEIHDRRKKEAHIRKCLQHTLFREWRIIPPIALLTWNTVVMAQSSSWNSWYLSIFALLMLADAIDHVGSVRTQAMLEWIEFQKNQDKSQS
jgi:hypothetical protein